MPTIKYTDLRREAVPDRLYMVVLGLTTDRARVIAQKAAGLARNMAPKLSGASAKRIVPIFGPGYFGLHWMDCLTPGHRVLRDDWRWVPVEELRVGDGLIAFDEEAPKGLAKGKSRGRRYRTGRVVQKGWGLRECVEVVFDDGTSVVCTENHPWLTRRWPTGGSREWVKATDLIPGHALGVYFDVWQEERTYEAGWLAGMFDGEGSLGHNGTRLGVTSWVAGTLNVTQKPGPILERLKDLLQERGYQIGERTTRSDVTNLEVLGGFAEQAHLLGSLRPERLVGKLRHEGRWMEAIRWRTVVEVKPVGRRGVVLLETSTSTYMAEGMGSHNSYLWFQERGIRPFTMTSLAGKTIPMWIDDPTGKERAKNPRAQTRTTGSGKTQVLIFRRAARIGQTKQVNRKIAGVVSSVSVPMSYPGAPGRIGRREASGPNTTPGRVGGAIAKGNVGVRWRHPGLTPRFFLDEGIRQAAKEHRVTGSVVTGAPTTRVYTPSGG